jgi:putative ABC transport system permease protein
VLRLIVGHGLRLALSGIAIGLFASLLATRLLRNLLYGVTAHDPVTFVLVPGLLLAVALAACAVPAWRASRVDPAIAMRVS